MKKLIFSISVLMLSLSGLFAECRLLAQMGRETYLRDLADYHMADLQNAYRILENESSIHNNGWGSVYYAGSDLMSGNDGIIWDQGFWTTGQSRFASNVAAGADAYFRRYIYNGNSDDTISTVLTEKDTRIMLTHIRKASSGSATIPDPHPFLYQKDGRTYSFIHNGTISNYSFLRTEARAIYDSHNWNDPSLLSLFDDPSDIDSSVYFGYLLCRIIENNWDIMRGLQQGIEHIGSSYSLNFILSDGYDLYAYRYENGTSTRPLWYFCDENFATIATVKSSGSTTYLAGANWVSMTNNELVYISGKKGLPPVVIKSFSSLTNARHLAWLKAPAEGQTESWSWRGFPVLNLSSTSAQVMTQSPGSGDGFSYADYVIDCDNERNYLEKDVNGAWANPQNLERFTQTGGYKIRSDRYDTALIQGSLVAGNTSVNTNGKRQFTVNYWLANSQSLKQALKDNWEHVKSVKTDDWYYVRQWDTMPSVPPVERSLVEDIDIDQDYYGNGSRPMEFGKAYTITLNSDFNLSNFQWCNSRKPQAIGRAKQTVTAFTYTEQSDYEGITIMSLEDGEDVQEIGVFAGDTCVGASVADTYPVQIMAYTGGYEDTPLSFRFYTGGRSNSAPVLQAQVFNEETSAYEKGVLFAGRNEFSSIKLTRDTASSVAPAEIYGVSNYPNPFNPETNISFTLTAKDKVKVELYNIKGQLVATAFEGYLGMGKQSVHWNGTTATGKRASSGMYFIKVSTSRSAAIKKAILIK